MLFNHIYEPQEDLEKNIETFSKTFEKELKGMKKHYPEVNTIQGLIEKYLCGIKSVELTYKESQNILPENVELYYKALSTQDILRQKYPQMFPNE